MKITHKTSLFAFTLFLCGMLFHTSCGSVRVTDCIDESKKSEGYCTTEYDPVCGCDGRTYSNPCGAERSGLTSWTKGKC